MKGLGGLPRKMVMKMGLWSGVEDDDDDDFFLYMKMMMFDEEDVNLKKKIGLIERKK